MTSFQLRRLFILHHISLVKFARRMVGDDGEDVVSAAFVKAYEKQYQGEQESKAMLFEIVRNACYDIIRRKHERRVEQKYIDYKMSLDEFEESCEAEIVRADLMSLIVKEIESLPDARKRIIKMLLDGDTVNEISQALNLSPDTIRCQKMRALKYLRKLKLEI